MESIDRKSELTRKGLAVIVAPLVAILALSATAWFLQGRTAAAQERIAMASAAREDGTEARAAMLDTLVAARTYVLETKGSSLDEFRFSRSQALKLLAEVQERKGDVDAGVTLSPELIAGVRQAFDDFEFAVSSGNVDVAEAIALLEEPTDAVRHLSVQLVKADADYDSYLAAAWSDIYRSRALSSILYPVLVLLALIGGWWSARRFSRDISTAAALLSQSRDEALDSRRLMDELLAVLPGAVFNVRLIDLKPLYLSPSYKALTGYEVDRVFDEPFFSTETIHPDDLAVLAEVPPTAPGVQTIVRFRFLHADGRYRWLEATYTFHEGSDPTSPEIVGYIRDISELVATEERLAETEQREEMILKTLSDAYVALDLDGTIREWNPAAEQIYGWGRDEVLGRNLIDVIVPGDMRDFAARQFEDMATKGESEVVGGRVETWGMRRDGTVFPIELLVTPITTAGKTRLHSFHADITARKRAEEETKAAKEEAERADRAKSEFLSRMSHELRTPLNAIIGFSQLLELDGLEGEHAENVEHISRAGHHLLDLINEVLDISRIESDRISLSVEGVQVYDVVRESLQLVDPLVASRKLSVVDEASSTNLTLKGDRQRVKQILINLLSNAAKYNFEEGSIRVTAREDGDRVVLAVSDTGPGIDESQMDQLFTPFNRLGAESSDVEGTGLGLTVSSKLAEAMGGSLEVASIKGRGSTFSLTLPRGQALQLPDVEPEAELTSIAPSDESRRILYIEDNPSNLLLVKRILQRRPDLHLDTATDGESGIAKARALGPDLVLLDLNLPDAWGADILSRLQRDPITQDIPVIMVTADATPGQIDRLLTAGAADYVTKPIDIKGLLRAIDTQLSKPTEVAS